MKQADNKATNRKRAAEGKGNSKRSAPATAGKSAGEQYNAGALTVLEGLRPVRVRPGMYIGDTDTKGLHHLLWEIIDNAIDEAANGYADQISVTLYEDGSVSVADNGRGMPVDLHPDKKVSGVELIFTQLHAGGKFDNKSYLISGGLHGVGASVVNALSEWLVAEVYRGGKRYRAEFHSYFDEAGEMVPGAVKKKLRQAGSTDKKGSFIHFKPDPRVFPHARLDNHTITQKLRELAYLNAGLTIVCEDRRQPEGQRQVVFSFAGGLADFVRYHNRGKAAAYPDPIVIKGESEGVSVEVALQHTDAYSESILSYVNNIRTGEGGTHETGLKMALTKVLNTAAREGGYLKEKEENYAGEDFREGMSAVLLVKMRDPQFEGQTKTKLGNVSVKTAVEAVVSEQFSRYVQNIRHEAVLKVILDKARQARQVREAAQRANALARQKSSLDVISLVGKFAPCIGRDPAVNELFIVEGDSAGGSAKQGRDRNFQAILPLKGKPLNSEKRRLDQILSNEEIRSIITALGTGIGKDFSPGALRYGKVIILADADQDGAHIRALLLTFFYRYMRPLLAAGHIYIGRPPLYRLETRGAKKEVRYAYSDQESERYSAEMGRGVTITRYKGLGEMNPGLLWETTLHPAHRTLIRVSIEDAAEAEQLVSVLMGDNAEVRKEYIVEHANFNRTDAFSKKMEKVT